MESWRNIYSYPAWTAYKEQSHHFINVGHKRNPSWNCHTVYTIFLSPLARTTFLKMHWRKRWVGQWNPNKILTILKKRMGHELRNKILVRNGMLNTELGNNKPSVLSSPNWIIECLLSTIWCEMTIAKNNIWLIYLHELILIFIE